MLYMTINQDCPSMKMTIFEILEIVGMDIRRLELDDALKIPIQVSKKLYKEKIPTTDLRTHLLSANQGTTFDGHTATMADILSCCAMVTVYDPDPASTTYKQVWVYHAFGGIINDGTMIFNIQNPGNKYIIYAVRDFSGDGDRGYDSNIGNILAHGYRSENLCIITNFGKNTDIDYKGGMQFY